MSRPNSLRRDYQGFSSSTYNYDQVLTPRTPHSRAGRAEEGRFIDQQQDQNYDLDVLQEEDEHQFASYSYSHGRNAQQQEPLLVSSASASFPDPPQRAKGKQKANELTIDLILSRIPLLVGLACGLFLLFLIVMSVEKPDALHSYMHGAAYNGSIDETETFKSEAAQDTDDAQSTPMGSETGMNMSNMISYAQYTSFPLEPMQYLEECVKVQKAMIESNMPMGTYWWVPPSGGLDVPHSEQVVSAKGEEAVNAVNKVCSSTITYQLDGFVGLAADLALMAQAAGLAREQNRTFFVDDRFWNRGRWSDHFEDVTQLQPGPEPGCIPPPAEELVACPRTARHWVINSRTAVFHFGHGFQDEFEDPYARELRRMKPIFQRAAQSLSSTILPNAESQALITQALQSLASPSSTSTPASELSESGQGLTPYIAVHIRRGDRKPEAWRYHGKYVPVQEYADAVKATIARLLPEDVSGNVVVYVASDDPAARTALELLLLTGPEGGVDTDTDVSDNANTDADADVGASSDDSAHRKRGGRVRVVSLDTMEDPSLSALASGAAYVQSEFNALSEEERVRLTRGALVDFALVSGLWAPSSSLADPESGDTAHKSSSSELGAQLEATICTLSSNFCKIAAVGLGWERAFGFEEGDPDKSIMAMDNDAKRWVEIDNRGDIIPVWRALEMFMA